mgnify:CR=1 FL=1
MRRSNGRCVITGLKAADAHHVIPQQMCRRRGIPVWDHRNGIALCKRTHDRHHSRLELIPYSVLPSSVLEFAAEHELGWYLERFYPTTDADD